MKILSNNDWQIYNNFELFSHVYSKQHRSAGTSEQYPWQLHTCTSSLPFLSGVCNQNYYYFKIKESWHSMNFLHPVVHTCNCTTGVWLRLQCVLHTLLGFHSMPTWIKTYNKIYHIIIINIQILKKEFVSNVDPCPLGEYILNKYIALNYTV